MLAQRHRCPLREWRGLLWSQICGIAASAERIESVTEQIEKQLAETSRELTQENGKDLQRELGRTDAMLRRGSGKSLGPEQVEISLNFRKTENS